MADCCSRTVVLLHDGELADVRALAESAVAEVIECSAGDALPEWDVLVATGRYAKAEWMRGGREKAVRIAVLDRDLRSPRAVMRREGIDLIVRRPVHPVALRLLLLHALYRGPERRARRVPVGAPVRFRAGLLRKAGVLTDLSMRGCQIVSRHVLRAGQSIVVWVPDGVSPSRSLAVRGTVVRCFAADGGEPGFGIEFGAVAAPVADRLKLAVRAWSDGPAASPRFEAGATQPLAARAHADLAREGSAADGASETTRDGRERRFAERHAYGGRRIVALGEEAARVLIGRDLSVGGMRVERAPGLAVGQRFQVAIHVAPGQTPLVISAEVLRDDGERGFAVRFADVDEAAARYLGKMVSALPVLSDGEGVVVSEIVSENA